MRVYEIANVDETSEISLKYSLILMTESEIQNEKYRKYQGTPIIIYSTRQAIKHFAHII